MLRLEEVIGNRHRRHRVTEFRKFLDAIDAAVPKDLDIHIVLDNYSTHKTASIQRWLAKRPRYHLHFTPTGSILDQLGRKVLRRTHQQTDSSRSPPQHPRFGKGHQVLSEGE
jgi:transposase